MTKSYYQAAQKANKSQHTTIDGPLIDKPLHRFYQQQSQEKDSSVAVRRRRLVAWRSVEKRKGHMPPMVQKPQYDVYHRQQTQVTKLLQQDEQGLPYPTSDNSNGRMRSSIRIVWLQEKMQSLPKSLALRTRFGDAGMQVHLHQRDLDADTKLDGELILLECFGMFEQEMMMAVFNIRLLSQAPLIVLTDNHTLDWSIRALHSGADALFTVNMPDDVIVARSKALLRRWASI
jgi:hypothetical protein